MTKRKKKPTPNNKSLSKTILGAKSQWQWDGDDVPAIFNEDDYWELDNRVDKRQPADDDSYSPASAKLETNIEIPRHVFNKIMFWVKRAKGECSGMGRFTVEGNTATINEIYLVDQVNTSSSTEMDAKALGKLSFETRGDVDKGHLNFWWHSHGSMDVFWSGTDHDTIHQIGNNGMVLAIVFNKKEEMKAAYYQRGDDFFMPVFRDDLPVFIVDEMDTDEMEAWGKEFDEKAKDKVFAPATTYRTVTHSTTPAVNYVKPTKAVRPPHDSKTKVNLQYFDLTFGEKLAVEEDFFKKHKREGKYHELLKFYKEEY